MNRKEKSVIRAYLRAVRHASHPESRMRIVLVGDSGTGEWWELLRVFPKLIYFLLWFQLEVVCLANTHKNRKNVVKECNVQCHFSGNMEIYYE